MDNTEADDTEWSLLNIRAKHGKSIPSMLRDIQLYQNDRVKSFEYIEKLDCLYVEHSSTNATKLGRQCINGFESENYVAVSYPWARSKYESPDKGGYLVKSRYDSLYMQSAVRDCIFSRVIKFMNFVRVKYFWIDQESIEQNTKTKEDGKKKADILDVMDLVYSQSSPSVALLSTPLDSEEDLLALGTIMSGEFILSERNISEMNSWVLECFRRAIRVLEKITSDPWWTRAWIFQEEYKAGKKMILMIPHRSSLEDIKSGFQGKFGNIPAELCISATDFREEATKLCIASRSLNRTDEEKRICDFILKRAGKYNISLQETDTEGNIQIRKSMSPFIVGEIGLRDASDSWDRLPIIGNSCRYSVRLDTKLLSQNHNSIGISMLALVFLNGEIFNNSIRGTSTGTLYDNTYEYFEKQAFNKFDAPVRQQLTWIKNCRFPAVELCMKGVTTQGHIWKLSKIIPTVNFPQDLPYEPDARNGLERRFRRRLRQLADILSPDGRGGYAFLAGQIDEFLEDDRKRGDQGNFVKRYQNLMAEELVGAIEAGQRLRLGLLTNNDHQSYRAIFVEPSDDGDQWDEDIPAYVFTASREGDIVYGEPTCDDLDCHVSLEVDISDYGLRNISTREPYLYTKRWVNGLCFFKQCPRKDVLFPYPPSLVEKS